MPADIMEKNSSSPVAATPASVNTTPDKPKTASEHRKVRAVPVFLCTPKKLSRGWGLLSPLKLRGEMAGPMGTQTLFFKNFLYSHQSLSWRKDEEQE